MEFWELEAGLSPVQAGYIASPAQRASLAAPAQPPAGTEIIGGQPTIPPAPFGYPVGAGPYLYGGQTVGGFPSGVGIGAGAGLLLPGMAGGIVGGLTGSGIAGAATAGALSGALGAGLGAGYGLGLGFGESATPGTGVAIGHEGVVNGIPVGGPGVPEPPKQWIAKEWNVKVDSKQHGTFRMYYFSLIDGRQMSYHSPTKTWKIWKPKKHIVISSNPRVKMLSKLNRLNKRVEKMLKPYQPKKPRTQMVPSRALSSIERAALK